MDTDCFTASSMLPARQSSRRTTLTGLVGGVSAALVAVVGLRGRAAAQDPTPRAGLVGSWRSLNTPRNRSPVSSLITFISDGTLIQTNSEHPTRSPAHGVWGRTGDRDYAYYFERLVFDAAGALIETHKARGRLRLTADGDAYAGELVSEFFDLAGTLVRGGNPGAIEATRLTL